MKKSSRLLHVLSGMMLLAFISGCVTNTTNTHDLLTAAGFKPVMADTPEKQQLLQTLPVKQVTMITWKGKVFYVQPDVPNNRAFVGTQAEYQSYQQMRLARQLSNDNLMAAQMNQEAMNRWGVWGPGIYGGFYGGVGRFR